MRDGLGPGNQPLDGPVDEAHQEQEDDGRGYEKGDQRQPDDPSFHENDLLLGFCQRHHHIQCAENFLVGGVKVAPAGRAARLVFDRSDDPQQPLPAGGGEKTGAFAERHVHRRRVPAVADVAGFGFDVGDLLQFFQVIGKLDGPLFIVDANVADLLQPGDVVDDLVDVVPGVEHHGVVGAELDGVAEPLRLRHELLLQIVLLIGDAEVGPGGDREHQDDAGDQDQFGGKAFSNPANESNHGGIHGAARKRAVAESRLAGAEAEAARQARYGCQDIENCAGLQPGGNSAPIGPGGSGKRVGGCPAREADAEP